MAKFNLTKLMAAAPGAAPVHIEDSGWLEGKSAADLKKLYSDYAAKLRAKQTELEASLGKPTRQTPKDRKWFARWYPEAIEAVAWEQGDKIVCLAVEHHDRETPVGLTVQCLTTDEIEELSAE